MPRRTQSQSARPPIEAVELLFATTNAHKVQEFQSLCDPMLVKVIGADTWQHNSGVELAPVIEDAPDFIGNALLKAASAARISGLSAVADDSGLVVNALDGKPGVHSARYAGEPRDDERNIDKLLKELEGASDRSAHFVCALVICGPIAEGHGCGRTDDGLAWRAFVGKVEGQILHDRQGSGGFGYDSVFFSEELQKSFGQASSEHKNSISHRGRAVQGLRIYLEAMARRRPEAPLFIRPVGYNALVTAMCNTIERNLRFANKALEASLAIRPQLGSKERSAISTLHWYALRNLSRLQMALHCLEGQVPQGAADPRQLRPEDASLLVCLLLADVDPMGTALSHSLPGERSALAGLLERSPSLKGTIPLKLKMAGKGLRAARARLSRQSGPHQLAAASGAHMDLIDALSIQWGHQGAQLALDYLNHQGPPTLRVNTTRATTSEVSEEVWRYGVISLTPPNMPNTLVCLRSARLTTSQLFHDGCFEIQDAGSQALVQLAAPQPGQRVADWCAGAGGKTLAIAEAVGESGQVIALDIHGGRLSECRRRLRRAGLRAEVRTHHEDPSKDSRLGDFDLVFVDAPCSSTGALRRTPELRWHIDQDWLGRFHEQQVAIALRAAKRVKPGGRMVYATCSIMRAENEDVVSRVLEQLQGWTLTWQHRIGPANLQWLETQPLSRIGPDGFFAAELKRPNQEPS